MKHYDFNITSLNDIPFSDVAEKYGTAIRRKGASLYMLCPYHDDHHASFCVSTKNINKGHCFACGKSVGPIQFVMDMNRCTFQEACETLSRDFNIPMIENDSFSSRNIRTIRNNRTLEDAPQGNRNIRTIRNNKTQEDAPQGNRNIRTIRNNKTLEDAPQGNRNIRIIRDVKKKSVTLAQYVKNARDAIDRASLGRKRMKEWEEQELAKRVYIPNDYYAPFISKENSFCKGLSHLFLQEGIELVTKDYQLGCYDKLGNPDDVMFPSIDVEGRIHNIKIQHYCTDQNNERFLHSDRNHMFWLGSLLKKEGMFPQDAVLDCTCFFGEHLLAKYPSTTVVLVESPKNAVIGRLEFPGFTWIAAGNKNNLTPKRLECLRGRHVIVIPDYDAMDEWKRKIDEAKHIATFHFSSFCTDKLKDLGEKGDVADYIISKEWINNDEWFTINDKMMSQAQSIV